jgi:single-strand selective monofunctional uracil DNA glycosylase
VRYNRAAVELVSIARKLSKDVDKLRFAAPVECVYNPLDYAAMPHEAYLTRYGGAGPGRVLMLGMNPGPFGMVQTGVPFGDVGFVRGWLEIDGLVEKPRREHPKRPIEGFACSRGEVSGTRLWGWAKDRFGTPARFFDRFFVLNYCPLAFLEDTGRNRTPDKLPAAEREPLYAACDRALRAQLATLRPSLVVGIGAFAFDRARPIGDELGIRVGTILHPSPASPRANRGWADEAERELRALGVDV